MSFEQFLGCESHETARLDEYGAGPLRLWHALARSGTLWHTLAHSGTDLADSGTTVTLWHG